MTNQTQPVIAEEVVSQVNNDSVSGQVQQRTQIFNDISDSPISLRSSTS